MTYLRDEKIPTDIDGDGDGDGAWIPVYTLPSYGYAGIAHLTPPEPSRYVAVWRIGLINLKEVEVYQRTSK